MLLIYLFRNVEKESFKIVKSIMPESILFGTYRKRRKLHTVMSALLILSYSKSHVEYFGTGMAVVR